MSEPSSIAAALLAFHRDAGELDLAKNRSAHTSDYLDLDKSMEQIRPLLARHGLFARHYTDWREGPGWVGGTILEHPASGETRDSGPFPIVPSKGDMQGNGGAFTYNRRYTLMGVLALVADNDDDQAPRQRRGQRATSGKINSAQRTQLMNAARAAKVPTDRLQELVRRVAGVEASADIPAEKFDELMKTVRAEKT